MKNTVSVTVPRFRSMGALENFLSSEPKTREWSFCETWNPTEHFINCFGGKDWVDHLSYDQIILFSLALKKYERAPNFSCRAGLFLSELIKMSEDAEISIITTQLRQKLDKMGYQNKDKKITIMGDVGRYLGMFMRGGEVYVRGNAGTNIGYGMTKGKIDLVGTLTPSNDRYELQGFQSIYGGEIRVRCPISFPIGMTSLAYCTIDLKCELDQVSFGEINGSTIHIEGRKPPISKNKLSRMKVQSQCFSDQELIRWETAKYRGGHIGKIIYKQVGEPFNVVEPTGEVKRHVPTMATAEYLLKN